MRAWWSDRLALVFFDQFLQQRLYGERVIVACPGGQQPGRQLERAVVVDVQRRLHSSDVRTIATEIPAPSQRQPLFSDTQCSLLRVRNVCNGSIHWY